jgi:hypothetical protein
MLLTCSLAGGMALAGQEGGRGSDRSARAQGGQDGEWEAIQRLEEQARSLAVAEGCADASQCRAAPVGARPCGGPRDYLVYCAASTNEDALLSVLEQLQRLEEQYNQRTGMMSICVFLPEPGVELVDGMCQAVGEEPVPLQ